MITTVSHEHEELTWHLQRDYCQFCRSEDNKDLTQQTLRTDLLGCELSSRKRICTSKASSYNRQNGCMAADLDDGRRDLNVAV